MSLRKKIELRVHLNEEKDIVTVHVDGRSTPIVVGCLGVDYDEAGQMTKIYTNACFHPSLKAREYLTWRPYGAISTILERCHDLVE